MTFRMTEEQVKAHQARIRKGAGTVRRTPECAASGTAAVPVAPKSSKYRNRATYVDGKRFPSILEADRYRELRFERLASRVKFFLRQVRFELPGGVVYVCDFEVHHADGRVEFEDTKGVLTQACKNKIAQVAELYGVEIRILRRADVQRFAHA